MASLILALAGVVSAQVVKPFPAHWGEPPEIQTRDYVELPAGFGHGSSTLAHWIKANLAQDKAAVDKGRPDEKPVLYKNDFEKAKPGELPDEFMVMQGGFAVREEGGNRFLELPGAPLDSFSVQFGPAETENVALSARIHGTSRGRRYPTFGVGLNGVSGHRLQVSPAKKALELLKDEELKATVPFDWKPDTWTAMRLQVRKIGDGQWQIEGKAWPQDGTESKEWMIATTENEEPVSGRASIFGSPFSGTPIRFDDLRVERVE